MAQTAAPRLVLGALTKTYAPAPSCTTAYQECATCSEAWQAQTCTNNGNKDSADCWPPRNSVASTPSPALNGWGFYSPGLICPSGFIRACSATAGGSSDWPVQFQLTGKETAVGCCPRYKLQYFEPYFLRTNSCSSGYSCMNSGYQTCILHASSTEFSMSSCGAGGTSANVVLFSLPTTVSKSTISIYSIYAPLIQINFQASDLTSSASRTSSASSSTSSISSTSPINTNTSTPTPAPGLSTGAKAGIGIGVALGALAVACLAFYIVWSRKKHTYVPAPENPTQTYELGETNKGPYATSELPQGSQIVELGPGEDAVHEERHVAELQ